MGDIMLFRHDEDISRDRTFLGINNTFDSMINGVARQELILIGGIRGSGKSITANNILVNQYEAGNTSAYFSIEMTGYETFQRTMSILADIDHGLLKQNKLPDDQLLKVIKARAGMFLEADDLVAKFLETRDMFGFEEQLVRTKELKPDNQMIIIDDRALTLTALDLHLGKLKAKFGDKFKAAVVDYVNQIVIEGANQFDWQPQIIISKKLKELARKYDIVMISPYQIDGTGEARFAKGILDAADIAMIMEAHDKDTGAISFETTKIRGAKELHFTSGMNWDSLRINPASREKPEKEEKKMKRAGKNKEDKKTQEEPEDIPWK